MKYQLYPKCFPLHTFIKKCVIENSENTFVDKFKKNNTSKLKRQIKYLITGKLQYLFGDDKLENCNAFYSTGVYYSGKDPYVLDLFDSIFSLAGYNYNLFLKNIEVIKESLMKENCIKIICRSKKNMEEIYKYFPNDKIKNKTILEIPNLKKIYYKKEKKNYLQLLFLGSINNDGDFYQKGGHYAIEILKKLQKDYKVKLILRCIAPINYIEEIEKNKDIIYLPKKLSEKDLDCLYKNSNILLSLNQAYVLMSTLEAKSYSIPIIALDTYKTKDFIEDKKEGYLINPPKNMNRFYKEKKYPTNIRNKDFINELKIIEEKVVNDSCDKIKLIIKNEKDIFIRN